jgi:hypothetical protein
MAWFADNIEGALQAWFGSLTVVYDGDAAAAALAATPASPDATGATEVACSTAATADEQQQQQGMIGTSAGDESASECSRGCGSSSSDSLQDQAQQEQQPGAEQMQQDKQNADPQQQQQQQRYIFGFQPHGLYPTGAGFLPWMPSFKQHFPGVNPVTLTATVIFFPPFIRDICCWAGFRQVGGYRG